MRKWAVMIAVVVSVFALSSCSVYYVYPDSSYTPPAQNYSAGSEVSASYGYSYYYERPYSPPPPVVVEQDYYIYKPEINVTNYIVVKISGSTYRFYRGGSEIAVWFIYSNGRVVKKGQLISGLVRAYNSSNRLVFETVCDNDEYNGPYREYYPNGKIRIETIYSKGLVDGYYRSYRSGGELEEEGIYRRGNKHGYYKVFGADGKEKEKAYYDNGKKRDFDEREKKEFENEWKESYRGYSEYMKAFDEDTRKNYVKPGNEPVKPGKIEKEEPAGGWGNYYGNRYGRSEEAKQNVEGAKEAREETKQFRFEAKEGAKQDAREIREEAKEAREEAKQFRFEAKEEAKQDAREIREEAKEAREEAKQFRYEAKEGVKQDAREIREEAKQFRYEAKEDAKQSNGDEVKQAEQDKGAAEKSKSEAVLRKSFDTAKERIVEKAAGRIKKEADFRQAEPEATKQEDKKEDAKEKKDIKEDKPANKNKFSK